MILKSIIYYAVLFGIFYVSMLSAQNLIKIKKKFKTENCDCGISNINEEDPKQIHPWQVLLTINWKKKKAKDENVHCQGTLISKKHIVTSVYCLQERVQFSKTRNR